MITAEFSVTPARRPANPARADFLRKLLAVEKSISGLAGEAADDVTAAILAGVGDDGKLPMAAVAAMTPPIERRLTVLSRQVENEIAGGLVDSAAAGVRSFKRDTTEEGVAGLIALAMMAGDEAIARATAERVAAEGIKGDSIGRQINRAVTVARDTIVSRATMTATIGGPVGELVRDARKILTGTSFKRSELTQRPDPFQYKGLVPALHRAAERVLAGTFAVAQVDWGLATETVTGWRWRLGEIERHCAFCVAHDGNIYRKSDPELYLIPAHEHCFCWWLPVMFKKDKI